MKQEVILVYVSADQSAILIVVRVTFNKSNVIIT